MKTLYLVMAVAGFIAPNIFVAQESIETGNVLLWLHPQATINGMFNNRIATAFIMDLLVVVLVFFIWTYREAKTHGIKNVWIIWVLTMLFGMAGTFPLFLYLRDRSKS
ncbi:MAG: DUF2834 domain-containing protein [Cyclobacteriaceae bacterium]